MKQGTNMHPIHMQRPEEDPRPDPKPIPDPTPDGGGGGGEPTWP